MKTYNAEEIKTKLAGLPEWKWVDNAIEREYSFRNFKQAMSFIVHLGLYAEQADHHPEIYNVYNKVRIRLNTHSVGGITDKDFDLASKIENIR